ncbi:MAG: hypothetical protein QOI80_2268 [Solirubrobacteraceae bacterium]|nr:hypothetical protein [Solirubrobacteraceae bacterium]
MLEQLLMKRSTANARQNAITRREIHSPCELSYAQELLWLLSQVFDDGIAYNAPGSFQLQGPLDLDRLRASLDALVARHEILHTTYDVIDDKPMQIIGEPAPTELNFIDLSELGSDDQQAEAQRILKQESRFRFDLVNGPVLRPTVIRLAADEHILMLNMHHVATDGYSRAALYRDLTAFYESSEDGTEALLPSLPIQYADYAVWHRKWLDGGVADTQLEYWKRKLAGAPSRLDLPTDFPRPPVRSWVGDNMSVMLDVATREGLRTAARSNDCTLFVALLAVFSTLLSRYSGQDDLVIGTPFAGRNRTELESMVGYFINPLALRIDLSGDPTFSELLLRARETTIEAFAAADVPYENVVRATNPERDLSQTPVYQAMIVLHNPAWQTERPKFEPRGIRCAEITHEKGWAKFDLLLGMSERTTGLNTTWEYSTELFAGQTVRRMIEHFRVLAENAAGDPDRRISGLSMLNESERGQVLYGWNPERVSAPSGGAIKERFEARVRETPDAVAVVSGEQRWTFDELNRRANQLAWRLREDGVGPGDTVGVLMVKSAELVAAVLAVAKAGGAYVPLDPMYPIDRIEFMISDAAPRVLLADARPSAPLPATDVPMVPIDWVELESMPVEDPPNASGDDDLAYVIYTSGSTGKPKGVMISNRSLSSASVAYEDAYRLSELTCHLQMASFSFDVFTGDLVRSLLAGAKLVLCPLEVTVDPPQLYDLMVREGVDAAEFVPAVIVPLFEFAEQTGRLLDFMKLIVISSEGWRTDRYELFRRRTGADTRIINAYGVTEATIDQTWYEPRPGTVLIPGRFMPIGGPLSNSRAYVLGPSLDPVPVGVAGELCVGGVSVAMGYLNRPELTAERFVADPFAPEPGARMYRTGDLARWLPDGAIEFLGRNDRQIKIRGFRIEPAEIETVLERHPLVRAATVVDRRDPDGDARIAAYLEPEGEGELDAADLRAFVSAQVPGYMVPAAYVTVPALPLTPNGKIDRNALPDPAWDRSAVTHEFREASTPTEQTLARIWSEVLGIEKVGTNDNFFALGGHSLLGMQVVSRIRLELPISLPLRAIFDTPTIAGLAASVDAAPKAEPEPQLVRLDRTRRGVRRPRRAGTTPSNSGQGPG